jgi:hypothetical protein
VAVAALPELYAGMDWSSADAASAARDRIADPLDRASSPRPQQGRMRCSRHQGPASVALRDLTLRAQQLPQLVG